MLSVLLILLHRSLKLSGDDDSEENMAEQKQPEVGFGELVSL